MKLKDGVILAGLRIEMRHALMTADRIWRQHGQELVITAGLDGAHSAGSLHYYGLAIDCRTRYFSVGDKQLVVNALKRSLPEEFDIVSHETHIHIEFDIFKG